MGSILLRSILFFVAVAAPLIAADHSVDPVLWYRHPAQTWSDALPVGNGRLGAMVFGDILKERIQLNEDTIWNGKKRDRINPEALKRSRGTALTVRKQASRGGNIGSAEDGGHPQSPATLSAVRRSEYRFPGRTTPAITAANWT